MLKEVRKYRSLNMELYEFSRSPVILQKSNLQVTASQNYFLVQPIPGRSGESV
jgi:hypothetical protein